MSVRDFFLPLVIASVAASASAGEPGPGPDPAADSKPKYDDRVVFERARRSAALAWKLIPYGRGAATRPKAFDDKRLVAQLSGLSDIIKTVDGSLKLKDQPDAILVHRRNVKKRIETFLAEMEAYKKAYAAAAEAERELARLKKSSPRLGRKGDQRANEREYRRWTDSINRARKRARTLSSEMSRRYVRSVAACGGIVSTLASIRASVRRIYELVFEKPVEIEFLVALPEEEPGGPAQAAGRSDGAPAKAAGAALEGSACTAEAFRKAVRRNDRDFLAGLEGRIVLWRVIPVGPAKESGDRLTVRVMAAGSPVTVELPRRTRAAPLGVGASILVAGEVRHGRDEWIVHAVGWGAWSEVAAGGAMNLCEWPEAD